MIYDSKHWKPSPIFPDKYIVSDTGEVFSFSRRMVLKPELSRGYFHYRLTSKGEKHHISAHRLVAMAFIPNPDNKELIDHINGIRTDNRVENLRWATYVENANNPNTFERQYEAAKRKLRRMTAIYKEGTLVATFESRAAAAEFVGVTPKTMYRYVSGKNGNNSGYTFKDISNISKGTK